MKQVSTFPYALHCTPGLNHHAYPVEIDSGSYSKPNHFIAWSPVHYPHYVGHYKTREAAQRKADEINSRQSEWTYCGHLPAHVQHDIYEQIKRKKS